MAMLGRRATRKRPSGGAFAPSDVAGLFAWYRADSITPQTDNTDLSTWSDLSGSGYHLTPDVNTAPNYIVAGINSKPVVRFNGTTDGLGYTSALSKTQPLTIFVVAKQAAASDIRVMLSSIDGDNCIVYMDGTSLKFNDGSLVTGGAFTSTDPNVLEFVANGASTAVYINGSGGVTGGGTQGLGTGLRVGVFTVGTQYFYNGDIAEVILYSAALSSTNRDAVRGYLGTKYGITVA